MTRTGLALEISRLAKNGELVSAMQYAYKHKKSRTWAENQLTEENGWIAMPLDNRVYYLKEK